MSDADDRTLEGLEGPKKRLRAPTCTCTYVCACMCTRTLEGLEGPKKRLRALEVEVVGGLIQQEQVWLCRQDLHRHHKSRPLAA